MTDANGDEQLERRIETARRHYVAALTPRDRHYWWQEMTTLIRRRSPQQVAKMEREKNLT